jgi:hypothetical protein
MREKYLAISSVVGGWSNILPALVGSALPSSSVTDAADAADVEAPGSEIEALGKKVAASGADAYSSCNRVRPSAMTGLVA